MNLKAFIDECAPRWEELDRLLHQARGKPERLGVSGVLELGRLHRASAADLALARVHFPGDPVIDRLAGLVGRSQYALYHAPSERGSIWGFLTRGYWQAVHARRGILVISLLALFAPALLAAIWAAWDPGAAIAVVPAAFRSAADPHLRHLPTGAITQATTAGSIFTNNIQVTFLAFAGGLLLGVGTLWLLAYNGVLLGLLAGLTIQAGTFSVFVRYVAPHGMLELSCITVSGAAGLRLASGLIEPGVLTRVQSLRVQARTAVLMILGTAPWLVLAGTVEGFVTPRGLPVPAALGIGVLLATIYWTFYLVRGGDRVKVGSQPSPSSHPEIALQATF